MRHVSVRADPKMCGLDEDGPILARSLVDVYAVGCKSSVLYENVQGKGIEQLQDL
jgi:hypothetical protein